MVTDLGRDVEFVRDVSQASGMHVVVATGIWRDGKLYAAKNFVTWSLIQNGPQKVVFELGYAPYDAGGVMVKETRRITLASGSNLNAIEARFDWEGGPDSLDVAAGIVKRAGSKPDSVKTGRNYMAYWKPPIGEDGSIACAVILPGEPRTESLPDQALMVTPVKRGQTLQSQAGAGWSKSGQFAAPEDWFKHIATAAAR